MALTSGLRQTCLICHLSEIAAEGPFRQEIRHWCKQIMCLAHPRHIICINLGLERLIVLVNRYPTLHGQRQRFLLSKGSTRTGQNRMDGLLQPD